MEVRAGSRAGRHDLKREAGTGSRGQALIGAPMISCVITIRCTMWSYALPSRLYYHHFWGHHHHFHHHHHHHFYRHPCVITISFTITIAIPIINTLTSMPSPLHSPSSSLLPSPLPLLLLALALSLPWVLFTMSNNLSHSFPRKQCVIFVFHD